MVNERIDKLNKMIDNYVEVAEDKNMRQNVPYENQKVTQEDMDEILQSFLDNKPNANKDALFIATKLWNEVQSLRSIILKQIY